MSSSVRFRPCDIITDANIRKLHLALAPHLFCSHRTEIPNTHHHDAMIFLLRVQNNREGCYDTGVYYYDTDA